MANDVQVHDEEYDPKEDQDHPERRGIPNIAAVPCGRSIGLRRKIASSLTSDCTAHRGGDFR